MCLHLTPASFCEINTENKDWSKLVDSDKKNKITGVSIDKGICDIKLKSQFSYPQCNELHHIKVNMCDRGSALIVLTVQWQSRGSFSCYSSCKGMWRNQRSAKRLSDFLFCVGLWSVSPPASNMNVFEKQIVAHLIPLRVPRHTHMWWLLNWFIWSPLFSSPSAPTYCRPARPPIYMII